MKNLSRLIIIIPVIALSCLTAFSQQGAVHMLYTVPNTSFIESKSGDHAVTINDASGSIASLQTAIDNARSANPTNVIVIHLLRGATYTVSNAGLVLGSHECLVGSGALIQAADASVTVPLITIASGSTNVAVAGGTLDGNGANINAILAPAATRVNIDKLTVLDCGQDGILLKGNGNSSYDNELSVTRCDVSGSAAHAGISIQNATQAAILDNNCHENSVGIYLSCAWATVANNTCDNNGTGINVAGGNDNVVANNTCDNNGTGIRAAGSKNMIVSNSTGNNSTAGISSSGTSGNFIDNLFTSGNAVNFSSGGATDNVVAYKTGLSASGQNYFYPPLIDNQHADPVVVNGMGRTDVTISSTSIDSVQSQYNSARANNPNDVIVLHLNGTFTVGANSLTLESNTCVLLNGTIQINSSTGASAAIKGGNSPDRVSISGGTIDGGNLTGNNGITVSSGSMIQVDNMTLQHFGNSANRSGGSDIIHFSGGSTPYIVTRCLLNGGAARGIWTQLSGQKSLISDNEVTDVNQDGVDNDSSTFGAVVKFNYCHDLVRYGVFFEQSASHDLALGNICNNDGRDINLYNNSTTPRGPTAFNSVIANFCLGSNGLRNGSTGDGLSAATSHNFIFNNVVTSASISSEDFGVENYYSQNYQRSGSLSTAGGGVESFFNSSDVDGNLQILDSNSGLGMVVQDGATTNSAPIVTDNPVDMGNGTGNDEWKFVPTDSGFYKIISKKTGLAMIVAGASSSAGAPVVQFAYSTNTTYNDEWQIQSAGNGLYNFVNRLSGLFLDVTGASITPGTQLQQWTANGHANQAFALVEDAPSLVAPDFTVTTTPISQTVVPGGSTSFTATVAPTNGFNSTVTFSVSGLPTGATGTFSPASVTGAGSSTLNVSTSTSTPGGSYTLTITGTSGSLSHSDTVTLVVSDFSVAATPSSQTTTVGSPANYTVNLGNINGFGGSISLSASGLPTGAGSSFSPASLTAPGSSSLTVTTSGSTPAANSTITITGTSGAISHSTNVTLKVTDFTLSASPTSQTLAAGSSTSYTITIGALNGFSGTVTFGSISGLPAGATATFNPGTVIGSGSATLTISTTTATAAGSYPLTITASSDSLSHSTPITLNVTDFSVSATPSSQTVTAGNNTTYTATIGAVNGFSSAVNLSVSGLPSGATATFNPTSVTGSGSSTLTISTTSSMSASTSTLTITGTSGSLTHTATVTLVVNASGTTWTTVNDTGPGITYSAGWNYSTNRNNGDFNNDVHYTKTNGNFATFTFTGTGVQYITETFSDEGNVDVYLDGVFQTTVSCNTSNRQSQFVAYSNTSLASGSHTVKVVKTSGTFMLVDAFAFTTGPSQPISLTDADIGAVGIAGSASFNNGVYTVSGSGSDIWTAADQFNFDYRNATNNVTVLARVSSESSTQGFAKAGVMIRESLATNAIEASVLLTPTNGVAMEVRGTTGASTVNMSGWVKPASPPTWVKITRSGSTFTGSFSADGITWTQLATTNVTMAVSTKAGLAVTAHSNAESNTATFSSLAIQ